MSTRESPETDRPEYYPGIFQYARPPLFFLRHVFCDNMAQSKKPLEKADVKSS